MQIAVNLATLRGSGSGRVGQCVLSEMAKFGDVFEAWIPAEWGWDSDYLGSNVELHQCRSGFVSKFITENMRIERRVNRGGRTDVLFSMGDTSLPRCRLPHLVMVQSAYLAYHPDEWDFDLPLAFRSKQKLIELYFRWMLESRPYLTVQTLDMKHRIAGRWQYPEDLISVIPSGVTVHSLSSAILEKRKEALGNYVCFVATPSPHKNFTVLADMMAALKQGGSELRCKLTVTADSVPSLVQRATALGVISRFEFLGMIDHAASLQLMANATALVMPSKLESFGLPYYEAMSVGCPVVAADRAFAREACGSAGLYAAADDGEAFAQLVRWLENPVHWAQQSAMVQQRFADVQQPWPTVARRYLDLLHSFK